MNSLCLVVAVISHPLHDLVSLSWSGVLDG